MIRTRRRCRACRWRARHLRRVRIISLHRAVPAAGARADSFAGGPVAAAFLRGLDLGLDARALDRAPAAPGIRAERRACARGRGLGLLTRVDGGSALPVLVTGSLL